MAEVVAFETRNSKGQMEAVEQPEARPGARAAASAGRRPHALQNGRRFFVALFIVKPGFC